MGKSDKKEKAKKRNKDKNHKRDKKDKVNKKSLLSKEAESQVTAAPDSFSLLLTHGLLMHPELLIEIPQMLIAMDSGECINVDAISHPERRRFLQAVFSHPSMPARHYSGSGWAKAEGCGCIRRAVLQSLLENGDVIHPQELSQVQARAVRMAPILQDLLKQIPELVTELGQLLAMLSSGETVDLSEMENKEVKKALSRCLNEIGVEQPENCGKYSFCLPELDEAVMRGALQCNAEVLIAMKDYEQDWSTAGQVRPEREDGIIKSAPSAQPTGAEQSDKASSDASESEDEESDSLSVGPMPAGAGLKGPAKPTAEQLVAASKAVTEVDNDHSTSDMSEIEFADSEVGPKLILNGVKEVTAEFNVAIASALGAEGFIMPGPIAAAMSSDELHSSSSNGGREEWMLTPGQNRPSGGIDQLFKSGKNKFEGGKEAKKAAAALKAEREALEKLMEDPEERKRTEAILAEYREKRGPSLMDAHLEKIGKKPKTVDTRLKSFDHDKEMGGNRKMNINDVQGLVSKSKELDTRFDKASVQKNFL